MNGYFRALKNCDPNEETVSVTVINGDAAGEKAVISGGKPVYYSKEEGFLKLNEKELCFLSGSGIKTVDGSDIYLERLGHEKKLVICGCGHVSIPVIRLAKMIGFKVTAIDDRPEFAQNAKEAGADRVISDSFRNALDSIDGDPFTYYVIVTRGHHWDEECLFAICKKRHAYIGMMGSKRRVAMAKESLFKEGIDKSVIDSLHSPIGLKIGSETPEEIAVSVMAEIIQVKNKNPDHPIPEDILAALNGQETEEESEKTEDTFAASEESAGMKATVKRKNILATIIRREGSAPRETGAKMLFTADSAINTIGGGLLEARAGKRAAEMIAEGAEKPEILHLELTADAAAAEGEVCGGRVDILLEPV